MGMDLNEICATLFNLVSRLKEEIDRIVHSRMSGVSGQFDLQVGIFSALNVHSPREYSLPCMQSLVKQSSLDVRDYMVAEGLPAW